MTISSDQRELSQALSAVREQPSDFGAWDALEAQAEAAQAPEAVAELYVETLAGELSAHGLRRLRERALRFGEAWFADDVPQMQDLLVRAFELDPSDDVIFERLLVSLKGAARWERLLHVYDRAIAAAGSLQRRIELLEEAIKVAEELAHDAPRALRLLRDLVYLRPDDPAVRARFERQLERGGHFHELVLSLTRAGAAPLPVAIEARVGGLWLRELGSAVRALEVAERLLAADPGQADALGLAEEIVGSERAPIAVRRSALGVLSQVYERSERALDRARVLRAGASLYEGAERGRIHDDAARILRALGQPAEALRELGEALVRMPDDDALLAELEAEAAQAGLPAPHAEALERAAEAAQTEGRRALLRLRAGQLRERALRDRSRAIELYRQVLAQDDARDAALEAGRALDALFDQSRDARARVPVLARLAELEPVAEVRRELLGGLAKVALATGDRARAEAAYQQRLEADARDQEALDGLVELHETSGDHEALVAALRRRAEASSGTRAAHDYARIARIYAEERFDVEAALDALGQVHALAPQLAEELALGSLLDRAAERDISEGARLSTALADAYRGWLADPERALAHYTRAIAAEPELSAARAGLTALLADERVRGRAADVLAGAYASQDEVAGLLELLPHRLATASSGAERGRLLRQAAQLECWRLGSPERAFVYSCDALIEDPNDTASDLEVWRLAEQLQTWGELAAALARAAARLEPPQPRYAQLRRQEGELSELRLLDLPRAFEAYRAASNALPGDASLAEACCRVAALLNRYPDAFEVVVTLADRLDQVPDELLALLEERAADSNGFAALSASARTILSDARLSAPVRRELLLRVAEWYERRADDLDGAEAVLLDASKLGGPHAEILRRLASLQRRAPSRALFDTLLAAAELQDRSLAELFEAAELARGPLADAELERKVLEQLVARGAQLVRSRAQPSTPPDADSAERRAAAREASSNEELLCEGVRRLADALSAAGEVAAELALLRDAASYPIAAAQARAFAERAATLALGPLDDAALGIALYRRALELAPDDPALLAALGAEYDRTGMLDDLVVLRRRQLATSSSVAQRLELRLELARVLGVLETRGGRLAALRENLREAPGHRESVLEAERILRAQGALAELYSLLAEQAAQLEAIGETRRAALLWKQAAAVADVELRDEERALDAYQRFAGLEHDEAALDALARLRLGRGEPELALPWLERILDARPATARVSVRVRLAQAQQLAGAVDSAIRSLEGGVQEAPDAFELRDLLAQLYEQHERFQPLAELLAESAERASDNALILAYARRAAALFAGRLAAPERAVAVLARAVQAAPDDRGLRLEYVDALIDAGQFDQAESALEAQVQEYGRRRSPERAELHLRLSRVARAKGDLERALDQLDTAASMDRSHPASLRALGELAVEAGQLERAERAYRTLLAIVRKPPPGVVPDLSAAEVLYRLHRIAVDLGQQEKATELLESAVQSAAQAEQDTARLKSLLLERGEPELLLRVLELRLSQVSSAATEAEVLSDLADVLESTLERRAEALDARLKALACAPELDGLHVATLRVAKLLGSERRYLDALLALIERARRKDDPALCSELALRAGSVAEHELADLEVAESSYRQVAEGLPGYVEAQFALARVAGKLGHEQEERTALERIALLPDRGDYADGKIAARYRLLELRVQNPVTREDGLWELSQLVSQQPDYARASQILKLAHDSDPSDVTTLSLLEQMARQSGDPGVLLEALERRAQHDQVSLELVREAAELALQQEQGERLERLLRRAIEIAEARQGLEQAAWAPLLLSRALQKRGDLDGALTWFELAMLVGDQASTFELGLALAAQAAETGQHRARAMRVYELLRERAPSDRRVWGPLLSFYHAEGELDRMVELVQASLESLSSQSDRNALRLETARLMFEAGREDQGALLLQQILAEDPDHAESALLLADLYERRGEREALLELLGRKFDSARERKSPSVIPISLRMGAMLAETEPEEASELYRKALVVAPQSDALLRAAIEQVDPDERPEERAALVVRYLSADDAAARERALEFALWLLDYRAEQLEPVGFEQALELAHRVAPEDAALTGRLLAWHRERDNYARLAALLEGEAQRERDAARAVAYLTEAAELRLSQLRQASEAAALLRKAREIDPGNLELLKRAVYASAASGELGPALAEVDSALERHGPGSPARVELLLLHAEIASRAGMQDDALAALSEAHGLAGDAVIEALTEGIERARVAARARGNLARERELTLRLADSFQRRGELERAIATLDDWRARASGDVPVLRALLELTTRAKRWDDVVLAAESLCEQDEPDALVAVGERLLEASRELGRVQRARAPLERALARAPGQPRLSALLEELYRELGDKRALAKLLSSRVEEAADPDQRFEQLRRVGQLLVEAGDADRAMDYLQQALAYRPDDLPTVIAVVDAHIGAGRGAQARALIEQTIGALKTRRSPELAQLRHRMAKLLAAAGDEQGRYEWLHHALDADMNNGEVASELAVVAQEHGQYETALKALRAITMMKGEVPMSRAEAFYRQAIIVAQKGETRRAVLWAKKAKAEDQHFPGVDRLIAELESA